MRKVIVIIMLVACAMSMMAEVAIQSTFNGCTLGKSTKSEVLKNISKLRGKIIAQNDTVILFSSAKTSAEGIKFRYCNVCFMDDTVSTIFFFDNIDKVSASQIEDVKAKYDSLKVLNGGYFLSKYQHTLGISNVDSTHVRANGDGVNTITIIEGDSSRGLVYEASTYIFMVQMRRIRKSVDDMYATLLPDYSKANAVTSVASCVFGDTRQNVTNKFRSKADHYLTSDSHSAMYGDVKVGGNRFKRGILYFLNDKFVACKFEIEFHTWKYEEAKATYEAIRSQYDRKYTNGRHVDKDKDNMFSAYGMFQDDYEGGKMCPIIISLQKGVSQGGDTYYYVSVSYFEGRLKTLYDDEI